MRSETCSGKGILNLTHNSGHYAADKKILGWNVPQKIDNSIDNAMFSVSIALYAQ